MRSLFSFYEIGKRACTLLCFRIIRHIRSLRTVSATRCLGKHCSPARSKHLPAGHFEVDDLRLFACCLHFGKNGGVAHLAVRVERRNEPQGYLVEYFFLLLAQIVRPLTGRNDCVVVGYLLVVKHFLRLRQ